MTGSPAIKFAPRLEARVLQRPSGGALHRRLPLPAARELRGEGPNLLRGAWTALATPFSNGDIAEKAFANLVSWQIEEGAQGLVVCSITGEGPTLTSEERDRLTRIAVEAAGGRVPVVAATGTSCTRETIALTQAAEETGASAAVIVTPYYNKPSQEGLYQHYREIAYSVGIPIIVESDPRRSCVEIQPETLARLAQIPKIIGIADTGGSLTGLGTRPDSVLPNLAWLSDNDDQLSVIYGMAGGQATVSVAANVLPKQWAEMHEASRHGDGRRVLLARQQLLPLLSALKLEPNPAPIKYALSFLRPWFGPSVRLPLAPVSCETSRAIIDALKTLDLID